MTGVRLDPFRTIVNVHWKEPSGYFLLAGTDGDLAFGAAEGYGTLQLVIPNPANPSERAVGAFLTTSGLPGNDTRFFDLGFTQTFIEDSSTDPPSPSEMAWLDGIVLTITGYPDSPITLGSGGYDRNYDTLSHITSYDKLVLDASIAFFDSGTNYPITYPGESSSTGP